MKSALHLPQMSVDEDMWGGRLDWYRDWISHPRTPTPTGMRDSGDCSSPSPPRSRCRCSSTRAGSTTTSAAPNRVRRAERAGQGTLLLRIGCWNHYFLNPLEGLEPKHLDAAEVPAALEWFDLTLKRKQTPMRQVEYYEIGSDSCMSPTPGRCRPQAPTKSGLSQAWRTDGRSSASRERRRIRL